MAASILRLSYYLRGTRVGLVAPERRAALAAFRDASLDGSFPGPAENARIPAKELEAFLAALDK